MCATVCLTVVPSFSDTTDVSTIGHSSKTDRSRTHLFHVAQYEDDIIGRELNLRKLPVGSGNRAHKPYEQMRPIMIKTNASTESATATYKVKHLPSNVAAANVAHHDMTYIFKVTNFEM